MNSTFTRVRRNTFQQNFSKTSLTFLRGWHDRWLVQPLIHIHVKLFSDSSSSLHGKRFGESVFSESHNPGFPSKDEYENVSNCVPSGIGPGNWLWERFKYARNVRLASCWGILPERLFLEKSNDSSWLRFPRDDGMVPVKLLLDKLSIIKDCNLPMLLGILHQICYLRGQ